MPIILRESKILDDIENVTSTALFSNFIQEAF